MLNNEAILKKLKDKNITPSIREGIDILHSINYYNKWWDDDEHFESLIIESIIVARRISESEVY